ncbi:MAG: peptidase M14 [Proteobacteria bacterium]|nr:peptidase M14 [Pseudomonadota bacterium]
MIKIIDFLPENILKLDANQLHTCVDDHTLMLLEGKIKRPLFISILQHGDETTGWDVLKIYLNNHLDKLPRSLCIAFGNIQAAKFNIRQLDGQVDFNRRWPGLKIPQDETAKKMSEITDFVQNMQPFASVDIHNNSGKNPHYAGINLLRSEYINLASLFSDTIIHFTSPDGIQSGAFSAFCPSVTIECGMSGTADGIEQTNTFLENLMHLSNLKQVPGIAEHQQVLNIFSSVKVRPEISLGFTNDDCQADIDFRLKHDLDHLNFHLIEENTSFGVIKEGGEMPLIVTDQIGEDITDRYFEINNQQVQLKKRVVPAMITQSIKAIRMDCLCYLMHPLRKL